MKPTGRLKKMYANGGPGPIDLSPNAGTPANETYEDYARGWLGRLKTQGPLNYTTGVDNPNIVAAGNVAGRNIVDPSKTQDFTPTSNVGVGQTIANGVNKLTPYLSNFVNSMRRPPAPVRGRMLQNVGLQKVDLSNERADIDRGTRTANLMARQSTDGASAAAVAGANAARNFEAKGNSYSREAQMNSGIANQQAQMNAGIDAQNIGRDDNYNNQVLEMKMAQQRAQSQNLSNASDKMVMERNADAARNLDTQKFKILSKAYGNGVVDRLANSVLGRGSGEAMTQEDYDKAMGIGKNAFGGKLKKVYAAGGPLADGPEPRPKTGAPIVNIRPTSADSLSLYNNATAVQSYYNKAGYQNTASVPAGDVEAKNEAARRSFTGKGVLTQNGIENVAPDQYYKPVDSNKYYQREQSNAVLDTRAPMTLYDKRIKPQSVNTYEPGTKGVQGDVVQMPAYDPIAIKPWNMLTPAERTLRTQKYGSNTAAAPASKLPELGRPATKVQADSPQAPAINIAPGVATAKNITGGPTSYSFSYRDEKGQQQSKYFDDHSSWKAFTDSNGYDDRNESADGSNGHATGTLKKALGGALNSRLAFGNQTPRLSGKLTRVKI